MNSYTSSDIHRTFHFLHKSLISVSSDKSKTFPKGLLGVFSIIALVLSLNKLSNSFGSKTQSEELELPFFFDF